MRSAPRFLLLLSIVSMLAVPSTASAQNWACNDSLATTQLSQPGSYYVCSCFCTFECFGATMTAPSTFTLNYIDFLYGTAGTPVNTFVNIAILENPIPGVSPGTPFVDAQGNESILEYFPMQQSASQFHRAEVAPSGVTPPVIQAGEDFSVTVCFNYDEENGADSFSPGSGHGPVLDQDGVQSMNWVSAWNPSIDELLNGDECGSLSSAYTWRMNPGLSGDYVLRVSDSALDWLAFDGCGTVAPGDDDDAVDDDDATPIPDDDDAVDDDDVAPSTLVVTEISPNETEIDTPIVVQISGQGFTPAPQVIIGGQAATDVTYLADVRIEATTPANLEEGTYDVEVRLPASGASNVLPGAFTVLTPEGDDTPRRDTACACGSMAPRSTGLALLLLAPLLVRRRR
jgi:hypothetical protein